jgi:hypothetical protein
MIGPAGVAQAANNKPNEASVNSKRLMFVFSFMVLETRRSRN